MPYLAIPSTASITRNSYDFTKSYRDLIFQEGKILIDSELNEIQQIQDDRLQAFINVLGNIFIDSSFKVAQTTIGTTYNNFTVTAGRTFLNGVGGYLAANVSYVSQVAGVQHVAQFAWNTTVTTPPPVLTTPGATVRNDLVVLNLILREINSTEDSFILDPDLGTQTSLRWKIQPVITVLQSFPTVSIPAFTASFTYWNEYGCWRTPIAWIRREASTAAITTSMIEDLRAAVTIPTIFQGAFVRLGRADVLTAKRGNAVIVNYDENGFTLGAAGGGVGGISAGSDAVLGDIGLQKNLEILKYEQAACPLVTAYNTAGALTSGTYQWKTSFYAKDILNSFAVTYLTTSQMHVSDSLIWFPNPTYIELIDLVSLASAATIISITSPKYLTSGFGYVWVVSNVASLLKVSPTTFAVMGTLAAGLNSPKGIVTDGRNIWISDSFHRKLMKINPVDMTIVASITVANTVEFIYTNGKYIWASSGSHDSINKFDIATSTVVATIANISRCIRLAGEGEALFALHSIAAAGGVVKIDTRTNAILACITVCTSPWGLAYDGKYVWVTSKDDALLRKVSFDLMQVVSTITLPSYAGDLRHNGMYLYAAVNNQLLRINGNAQDQETIASFESAAIYASASMATVYLPTGDPNRVGGRKVYRWKQSTSYPYVLVATVADNTTVSVTDNYAQATLESIANPYSLSYDSTKFMPSEPFFNGGIWIGGKKVGQWS